MAERNKNQNGGRAAAGRGGLLCPLWQETKAVPRCNEGTAALQCCSLVYMHDAEANALMLTNEQWKFHSGLQHILSNVIQNSLLLFNYLRQEGYMTAGI